MHVHPFLYNRTEMTKHASCLKFSKEEFRRIMEQKKMQVLEDDYDWWTERMARHEMYMQLRQTGELNYSQLAYLKGKGLQSIPQFLLYSTQFSVVGIEENLKRKKSRNRIQYVMRSGDEGRGGKVLFKDAADVTKYNSYKAI